MASFSEFENLEEEIKELLHNYKNKKATVYEPCTNENFKECLIGLNEELSILKFNINYTFNPYIDVEKDTLQTDALVKLINCVWTLLHHHKNTVEKAERLVDENHVLQYTNKQLNVSYSAHGIGTSLYVYVREMAMLSILGPWERRVALTDLVQQWTAIGYSLITSTVSRLKNKSNSEKNEAKACVASAQRISHRSEEIWKTLSETQAKLTQLTKQKEASEKCLQNEIARLKQQNEKLMDRLRNKKDIHTSCSEVCDTTLRQLQDQKRRQDTVIAQLQANNQELLREIITMKEDLLSM